MASAQDATAEKRAVRKEELVFLTSGAKEKVDKTLAGMKGAGHIMTHPFSKDAREEANAKTVEEKDKVASKQASIREAAHQQAELERAAAGGVHPPVQGEDTPIPESESRNADESVERFSEGSTSSSDESGRGRGQVPPTSADYRSG